MEDKKCKRRDILVRELINDWDELNISFKALIVVGVILFLIVLFMAFMGDGDVTSDEYTLQAVFRSTLSSIFGFLLSSNIKFNGTKRKMHIEKMKSELSKVQWELEEKDLLEKICKLEEKYTFKDINVVQLLIALVICITCIIVLTILMVTENLSNHQAVAQIRDLMCSSIGFIIGESKNK